MSRTIFKSFSDYEAEVEGKLSRRPLCCNCQEPIQDDEAYEIDGLLYCENCIRDAKVHVYDLEDYVE